MKKFIYFLAIASILTGCKEEIKTSYTIEGTAKNVYNGMRVYLSKIDPRGRPIAKDTALVMNETFTFDGSVEYPELYYITINGTPGRLAVMVENGDLKLDIDNTVITNSTFKGSESNAVYKTYYAKMSELQKNATNAQTNLRSSQFLKDSVKIKEDEKIFKEASKKLAEYTYDYIEDNNNNFGVLPIFNSQLNTRGANLDKMVAIYDNLSSDIKSSPDAIKIKQNIDLIKAKVEAEKVTAIGAIAPGFSAPSPDGEIIALNDVVKKGKVTIIDFWAAWCGPCRRENPNVVKLYNEYHDKGLEIIGVGLDGRRGQQNPKDAWQKAIKDDKLTWHQVSNLKYFDDIAKVYNVNSIPSMFVLDNDGKIIAKNLRGRNLENKIAELLN